MPAGNFGARTLDDLLEEFQVVRAATVQLARHLDEETLTRRGSANGNDISVRALLYIIAGHERHHAALFRERYLISRSAETRIATGGQYDALVVRQERENTSS